MLKLKSPAGGLRATAIDSTTSFTVPNDGTTTARVEVSALKNSLVIVRVNGIDRLTISGLSGATTGNQRYLVAGINRYDGSQAQTKRVFHAKLWATTQGWPGDGTTPTQVLERYTGRFDKKLDPASSLLEMGARPYDPSLGRFFAADPVEGGSLNAYDYGNQDAVGQYDLDGTESSGCPWPSKIPFIGDEYCEGFQSLSPTWQGIAGASVEAGPYVLGGAGVARGITSRVAGRYLISFGTRTSIGRFLFGTPRYSGGVRGILNRGRIRIGVGNHQGRPVFRIGIGNRHFDFPR